MKSRRQLINERDALLQQIRAYNERTYRWNDRYVGCPDNCEYRGEPHTHTMQKREYVRWNPIE